MLDDATPRRPRNVALRSNLPEIFTDDYGTLSLGHAEAFQSVGYEADQMRLALDAILAAAMPAHPKFLTLAPFAVARWERDLGLPTDASKPIENRVNAILAQLRGFGTATRQRVSAVANSFENGQVTIAEDYASYTVTFTFVSLLGMPPYLEALQSAVEAIVPAHLLSVWRFLWTTYGMLTEYDETFAVLSGSGMTYAALPTYPGAD